MPRSKLFQKNIPHELNPSIKSIESSTKQDGKERVITVCRKNKKLNIKLTKGNSSESLAMSCNRGDDRMGDIHTHPSTEHAMGITPSAGDLTVNLANTKQQNSKQVTCITSPDSINIHCIEAKKIPDIQKVKEYEFGRINSYGVQLDPYILENAPKDFNHMWFNKDNLNKINPQARDVVSDALGQSNEKIRKNMEDMNKDYFCKKIIQNLNKPTDNNVQRVCKEELKRRFFDWL